MSGWKAKRFWTEATVVAAEGGYTVHLDARPVRTPAKTPLIVPTQALAAEIAAEWNAQQGEVRPQGMPFTRSANAALDKVRPQHAEVAALIAEYGGTDLLCYRALAPLELQARQAVAWDPLLDWAAARFGAPLTVGQGVMHVPQPPDVLVAMADEVNSLCAFRLTALHDLVGISGSLIIGLAVCEGHMSADEAWHLSRIDEAWQAEIWGHDDEAAAQAALKQRDFVHAKRFHDLGRSD